MCTTGGGSIPGGALAVIAASMAVWVGSAAVGQPLLVDFELIPGMPNAPGAPVPAASRLSDQYLAMFGVRFSSNSPYVAVVSLGPNHAVSGTQGIGGTTADGDLSYQSANPIIASFFDSTGSQPMVVTTVSIHGDEIYATGTKTMQAFDVSGTLIATVTLPDDADPLVISAPGIHSVAITGSQGNIAFDDLRFDQPQSVCSGTCRADFNCSGSVTIQDIFDYLTAWFARAASADFNRSGTVTVQDIFDFLTAWFAGCH